MGKKKILVTGANGQLGREIKAASDSYPHDEFVFLSRNELPINDPEKVASVFMKHLPDFCINCAAYTAVDKAESEKENAFLINAEAVGVLAGSCRQHRTKFIHISTDYVFDGSSAVPLKETDVPHPLNTYGASKLKGEELAFRVNADTIVIRTSWVYSEFGNNFVKTMIRLMQERDSINVVNDQIGSPTYAADLAGVILQIINSGRFVPGIYHYSNMGQISWYEFALGIKELIKSDCQVNPIASSAYPTPAIRPRFSLLDKSKIISTYSLKIEDWRKSLSVCIDKIKKQE